MICAEDILHRVEDIPPLPGAVVQLIGVLNNADSSVDEIVKVIQYDQVLTTQMLRLCNSAYFGATRSVNTLEDALRYLGTSKVLQLVLTLNTTSLLNHAQRGYMMHSGALWRHSVGVAIGASLFAQRMRFEQVSLAFTCGLLHDIGKLILDKYVGDAFQVIIGRVVEDRISFDEAEKEILGFSHAEIGARLADRWQLSESICRCILHHHTPEQLEPPDALVDIVYLSDTVCLLMGVGLGEDALFHRAKPLVMERRGFSEQDLETIGVSMMNELMKVELAYGHSRPEATHTCREAGDTR